MIIEQNSIKCEYSHIHKKFTIKCEGFKIQEISLNDILNKKCIYFREYHHEGESFESYINAITNNKFILILQYILDGKCEDTDDVDSITYLITMDEYDAIDYSILFSSNAIHFEES